MVAMQRFLALSSALMLVACDLAPEFATPKTDTPARFKEAESADGRVVEDGNWKRFDEGAAAEFGKGEWWKLFGDARLDALIASGMKHSPTLAAARERLIQSRKQLDVARSAWLPDVTAGTGANRQRYSSANPMMGGGAPKPYTLYRAQVGIDYDLDIFGRTRNTVKAARSRASAQKALLSGTRLTLQAEIARNYFALLSLSEEEAMLKRSLVLREETLNLTRTKYEVGEVSDLDVARAEGEFSTTESDLLSVVQERAVTEHLLATLTGKAPADFALPECTLKPGVHRSCDLLAPAPQVPAGLPSSLLERRPDLVAAADELAARNAEIGIARAAFFPSINLTSSFGYEADTLGSLFEWSSRTWLIGPASGTFLSLPVFTGGRNTANLMLSKSSYREQVATYRGTVLSAFREVEDALVTTRVARERTLSQQRALNAGARAYRIAKLQYQDGYGGYLELIDAERTLITAARGEVQARGQQYISTVTLIQALGGGWETATPETPAPAPVAAPEPPVKAKKAPKRLPRPWDDKAKAADVPAALPEAAPPATPEPAPIPFRKRRPNKPVPGLEQPAAAPVMQDLDTENAPENTILPFQHQGKAK